MITNYVLKLLKYLFLFCTLFLLIEFIFHFQNFLLSAFLWLITSGLITHFRIISDTEKNLKKLKTDLNLLKYQLSAKEKLLTETEIENKALKASLKEKASGFPTLLHIIETFEKGKDDLDAYILAHKKNPAFNASKKVKEHSERRRIAETQYKKAQVLIEYYESIAPFLIDIREEEFDKDFLEHEIENSEYTDKEKADETTKYITTLEYRKLPESERNQLALDRYIQRKKSKENIGKTYERFVGSIYESAGYDVEFHGIKKGVEDLGIDLICKRNKEHILVQCKCWSKHKNIFENHIFQFFGTTYIYRKQNPDKEVQGIFYTTTTVSPFAKQMGLELDVKIIENHHFEINYPCIKCNIAKSTGEKIYHLPFDQMYDKVKIEVNKGEFYCQTVREAEAKGFRRAFKHNWNN